MLYTKTERKSERVQMFSALDDFSMGESLEKPEDVRIADNYVIISVRWPIEAEDLTESDLFSIQLSKLRGIGR